MARVNLTAVAVAAIPLAGCAAGGAMCPDARGETDARLGLVAFAERPHAGARSCEQTAFWPICDVPFAAAFSARPDLVATYGIGPAHGWRGWRLELRTPSEGRKRWFHTVGLGLGEGGGQRHAAVSLRGYFMHSVTASGGTYTFWEAGAGPLAEEDSDETIASGAYLATGARLRLGVFVATISVGVGAAADDYKNVLAPTGELSVGLSF